MSDCPLVSTATDVLREEVSIFDTFRQTDLPTLQIIPETAGLARLDIELTTRNRREHWLTENDSRLVHPKCSGLHRHGHSRSSRWRTSNERRQVTPRVCAHVVRSERHARLDDRNLVEAANHLEGKTDR